MAFSIEKALQAISERFTPEMRAEMESRSRKSIGRVDPSSPAAKLHRLMRLTESVRNQIEHLKTRPNGELKNRRMRHLLNRLSELLSEQGDYAGAMAVAVDERRFNIYKEIKEAIERSREITCDCPVVRARVGRDTVALNPRFVVQTIRTPLGERSLIRCSNCGALNVK